MSDFLSFSCTLPRQYLTATLSALDKYKVLDLAVKSDTEHPMNKVLTFTAEREDSHKIEEAINVATNRYFNKLEIREQNV